VLTYDAVQVQGIGAASSGILLKYSSAGQALWGRTAAAGPLAPDSYFASVAVSDAGNVYVSGNQTGTDPYLYGDVQVAGAHTGTNAVMVKFDLDGNPVWATSTSQAGNNSGFISIAVTADMLVVGGSQFGDGLFEYVSVQASGRGTVGFNALVVRYEP
jgi:hypothetical protein